MIQVVHGITYFKYLSDVVLIRLRFLQYISYNLNMFNYSGECSITQKPRSEFKMPCLSVTLQR